MAYYADRRTPAEQADLFAPDGVVTVYEGERQLRGSETLAAGFASFGCYEATTHFVGLRSRPRTGPVCNRPVRTPS
ncbi:nuclear transport factor 2 family protein [Amycolatopsis carbonis]|uniref:nuclear transport factor 2 family protein n=1 Tax=Amycolatopsis carbonis TaxID=715471 RepID=UPI00333F55CE